MSEVVDSTAEEVGNATFPVDSYREAAPHLRRPFTPQAVKFKVQTVSGNNAMVVAFIDVRLVVERLNLIVPHLWRDAYNGPECSLTIDGLTRCDVGEGQGKALRSDSLKRAAVKFGIGVSLYAVPKKWLKVDGEQVKHVGKAYYIQPAGEKACRAHYQQWLHDMGITAFGEPLDHGDHDEAQGDVEVDQISGPEESAPARVQGGITQEQFDHLTGRVKELGPEVGPVIHAWLDERGVVAAEKVVPRFKTLSPKVALDLQKFLAEQTPAADVMPVPEDLS